MDFMGKEILSFNQKKLLDIFAQSPFIRDFYLTGGTALAVYYLGHRYSEDLDFFTDKENLDVIGLTNTLEKIREKVGAKTVEYQQLLNRNLFFIKFDEETVKTEFTYFPFKQIEKPIVENNLAVDSLLDIAVNKLFTIHQKPRSRDFIDLFFIVKEKNYSFSELIDMIRVKFDWPIDFINLGAQLMKVADLKDLPRMIKPFDEKTVSDFFLKEASLLGERFLK